MRENLHITEDRPCEGRTPASRQREPSRPSRKDKGRRAFASTFGTQVAASNRKNGQREDSLPTCELTGKAQGEKLPTDAGHPSPPTTEQDAPSACAAQRACTGLGPGCALSTGRPPSSSSCRPGDRFTSPADSALRPRPGRGIVRPPATRAEVTMPCSHLHYSWYLLPGSYLLHCVDQLLALGNQGSTACPLSNPLSQAS